MGFYKSTVNHKEGDLLRMDERGPVYIWYKEHWRLLPRIYQEAYVVLDNMHLPKNIGVSWTLHMLLETEIQGGNWYLDREKDNGILQNDNH